MVSLASILLLGFFLGMRHATDADHVVAVTTIVGRARSFRAALAIGALWGLGHSATILAVGGAIVVLGWVIPPRLGLSMEMSVAVMLVILGLMNLTGIMKRIDEAAHAANRPDTAQHALPERSAAKRLGFTSSFRPLFVGIVHGLAGSAAVALLVLGTIPDPHWALLYLSIFGAGTVLGMMLLTAAMIAPLVALTKRFGSVERVMSGITGLASIAFGLFLVYKIGVVDGLFGNAPTWDPR